jgi:magnesium transporter
MNTAAELAEEIRTRSADAAARKLEQFAPTEIASALMQLTPAFAQDVLAALPDAQRELLFSAAPDAVARQWERNALYGHDAIGRLMEPVVGAFTPEWTVAETVEALRERVKSMLITYVWVVDGDSRLIGIVTMRDLLFAEKHFTLREVMTKDPFVLQAAMPLRDAMKQVLDRHYPVYPVLDAAGRLTGLVRGQAMFEAQAIEISLQAGSMMGVEKEERVATPWHHSLKLRHPWLQLNLLTAFLAAAVVGLFQDTPSTAW